MNNLSLHESNVIQWAIARNILGTTGKGTKRGQLEKTREEVNELHDALLLNDQSLARDAIGDIIVTLIIQANLWGLTLDDCLSTAWDQIKDRRGKMVGGVFVKEALS